MEVLGTLWWLVASAVSLVWSLVWFLISGWVATLAQVLIVVAAIFGFKYGWRRAPFEAWRAMQGVARLFWPWLRARDLARPDAAQIEPRNMIRGARVRERGDINVSTLLSLAALAGVCAVRLWL